MVSRRLKCRILEKMFYFNEVVKDINRKKAQIKILVYMWILEWLSSVCLLCTIWVFEIDEVFAEIIRKVFR